MCALKASYPHIRQRVLSPDWRGENVLIVGNGTSTASLSPLLLAEFSTLYGRVIVINSGSYVFPRADLLVCPDKTWLGQHSGLGHFLGPEIITTQPDHVNFTDERLGWMKRIFIGSGRHSCVKSAILDPSMVVEGHTGISTAIAISVLRGAKRIIIVGMDLAPGPDDKRRLWGTETDTERHKFRYGVQIQHLAAQYRVIKAAGYKVDILNASPLSECQVYPYANFKDLMRLVRAEGPRRSRNEHL